MNTWALVWIVLKVAGAIFVLWLGLQLLAAVVEHFWSKRQ